MIYSFQIKKEHLQELKDVIRTKTKTVRFECNPFEIGDIVQIRLSLNVSESSIINELQNKWDAINVPPEKNKNWIQKLKFWK